MYVFSGNSIPVWWLISCGCADVALQLARRPTRARTTPSTDIWPSSCSRSRASPVRRPPFLCLTSTRGADTICARDQSSGSSDPRRTCWFAYSPASKAAAVVTRRARSCTRVSGIDAYLVRIICCPHLGLSSFFQVFSARASLLVSVCPASPNTALALCGIPDVQLVIQYKMTTITKK